MPPTLSVSMAETTSDPDDIIGSYLANIRGTVPLTIEQIDAILRLFAAARAEVRSLLDLSCDGGTILAAALDEHPQLNAVLVEDSARRLEATRQRLGDAADRVTCRSARYGSPAWSAVLAELGPYDIVIAGAEAWPLSDERKRQIYEEVYRALMPGGLFLNVEHVASATRWTQSPMDDQMIDVIFGEFIRAGKKKSRTQIARQYYERVKSQTAHHAPLEVQCDWLRDIGFESVECFLKVAELAVFGGQKNEAGQGVFTF